MSRLFLFVFSLLLAVRFLLPMSVAAQPAAPEQQPRAETPDFVAAAFQQTGCRTFQQWVIQRLTFPLGMFFDGQEVFAFARFEVTKAGKVRNIEIKAPTSPVFGERLSAVIAASAEWTPERKAGKNELSVQVLNLSLKLHLNDRGALYAEDIAVYGRTEQTPRFEGGASKVLSHWITDRVGDTFPDGTPIDAKVKVGMIVEKDGSISNVQTGKVSSQWLARRILTVLQEAPRFTPALHFGDTVRARITVNVDFTPACSASADSAVPDSVAHPADEVDKAYLVVETMPKFQGGTLSNFRTWVGRNLSYPRVAVEERIEGRVVVRFIVETDGDVSQIEVIESPHTQLSQAAIEAVGRSPKWTPGMQNGKPVRVRYTLPLDFRLSSPADRITPSRQHSSSPFGVPVAGSRR